MKIVLTICGMVSFTVIANLLLKTGAVSGVPGPRIPINGGVVRLAAGPAGLWVTNGDHTVALIDRVTRIAGMPLAVGAGPIGVAVEQGIAWIANSDDGTVSRLDASDGHSIGSPIMVGGTPVSVVVADGRAWVMQQDARTVTQLDSGTGAQSGGPTGLGTRPRDAARSTEGVWVVGVDPSAAVLLRG